MDAVELPAKSCVPAVGRYTIRKHKIAAQDDEKGNTGDNPGLELELLALLPVSVDLRLLLPLCRLLRDHVGEVLAAACAWYMHTAARVLVVLALEVLRRHAFQLFGINRDVHTVLALQSSSVPVHKSTKVQAYLLSTLIAKNWYCGTGDCADIVASFAAHETANVGLLLRHDLVQ